MKLNQRHILGITIISLLAFLAMWTDELYSKQVGLFDHRYEVVKIIMHSAITYKLAKYLIKKLKLEMRFMEVNAIKIFLISFLLLNSYILTQYLTRTISNNIINKEIRNDLTIRTIKLDHSGWGYESDSLNFREFKEISKYSKIIEIPKESDLIFVHDWYEFDFRRAVEFNVPLNFDINNFYKNDTTILNNIRELKNGEYLNRTLKDGLGDKHRNINLKIDSSHFKRYKYEVGES